MVDQKIIFACAVAMATSAVALIVLIRIAKPLSLIDLPDHRKHHRGSIPLVGGLAILIGALSGMWVLSRFDRFELMLLWTSALLLIVGVQDDRRDVSVRTRLLVQTGAILLMIVSTGVYVRTLGGGVELGWLGVPFTVLAVIGLLNAFNLMDGIDCLAGSLALLSIIALLLLSGANPTQGTAALLLLLACALAPFLLSNGGLFGARWKCFLGDSGATLLGYMLAWTLIEFSQTGSTSLTPTATLWCVALPVMDTCAVMYRRLREGRSPFKPGNGHIHHLLVGAGLSPRVAVIVLIAFAIALAFLGAFVRWLHLGVGSNIVAFCILMIAYISISTHMYVRQRSPAFRRDHPERIPSPAKGDMAA